MGLVVGSTSVTSSRAQALQQHCYKETNFPALSSEVNTLFIMAGRGTVTHKIPGVLGTQALHEPSGRISPLPFCLAAQSSSVLKEDPQVWVHLCKVLINLSASACTEMLEKGYCRQS